jgi:hypothetical protein
MKNLWCVLELDLLTKSEGREKIAKKVLNRHPSGLVLGSAFTRLSIVVAICNCGQSVVTCDNGLVCSLLLC